MSSKTAVAREDAARETLLLFVVVALRVGITAERAERAGIALRETVVVLRVLRTVPAAPERAETAVRDEVVDRCAAERATESDSARFTSRPIARAGATFESVTTRAFCVGAASTEPVAKNVASNAKQRKDFIVIFFTFISLFDAF